MVIISGLVAIYYNMIIAYTLYYFFASLAKDVPWQDCKDSWKKYGCVDRKASCGKIATLKIPEKAQNTNFGFKT